MKLKISLAVSCLVIVAVATQVFCQPVDAQASDQSVLVTEESTSPATTETKDVSYQYVAQEGDSYTQILRKATQTYGAKYKVDLSLAQIVYIETNLAQQAGSPILDVGDAVAVQESTLRAWVDKAKGLSEDQVVEWDFYTQFVNFDTSAVGEATAN